MLEDISRDISPDGFIDAMMFDAFPQAIPVQGFLGGLMIGVAAAIMLLGLGRIAGVSGMLARSLGIASSGIRRRVAAAFVIGLPLGAFVFQAIAGPVLARYPQSLLLLVIGGLIVGFGTRMGSGCTSGHGVCGVSRLSRRSLLATALFIGAGIATVAIMNYLGVG